MNPISGMRMMFWQILHVQLTVDLCVVMCGCYLATRTLLDPLCLYQN